MGHRDTWNKGIHGTEGYNEHRYTWSTGVCGRDTWDIGIHGTQGYMGQRDTWETGINGTQDTWEEEKKGKKGYN